MIMYKNIVYKIQKRKPLQNFLFCYFEPLVGFEPTTPRLQITCSGQLSYIGIVVFPYLERASLDLGLQR